MEGFRKDIHGLRGIAVALVMAFHCRVPQLSAGFVGVDVFFVLSGHLIAKRLHSGEWTKLSSLPAFWSARLVRLCPLLALAAALTLAVGRAILAFEDLRSLTKSALAAVFGASNIYFFATLKDGYFGTDTRKVPLLHTWSLAAELQFYLAFSLLSTLRPLGLRRAVEMSAFASSLALFFYPGLGSSYLLPTARFWEFLLGTFSGTLMKSTLTSSMLESTAVLCIAGLGLAASGVLSEKLSSLLACLVTWLLIGVGSTTSPESQQDFIAAILRLQPLQVLGDISYSLYIWHWPILSFTDFIAPDLTPLDLLMLMTPVVLLSFLTKRFGEDATRKLSLPLWKSALCCSAIPGAVVGSFWLGINTLPPSSGGRSFAEVLSLSYDGPLAKACAEGLKTLPRVVKVTASCRIGLNDSGPVEVFLTGDSHARSYAGFVDRLLTKAQKRGLVHSKIGVPYLDGDWLPKRQPLKKFSERVSRFIRTQPDLRFVVLAGYWDGWHDEFPEETKERKYSQLRRALNRTLSFLKRKRKIKVVILLDYPSAQNKPRNCDLMNLPAETCLIDRNRSEALQAKGKAVVVELGQLYKARLVDVYDQLCSAAHCPMSIDGLPLYADTMENAQLSSHLNFQTAALLADKYLRKCSNPFS